MKTNVLACALAAAATALLPSITGAAPPAHAQARQPKPSPAKPGQRTSPTKHFRHNGKAFILNAARPGLDPNRGDPMAIGRGIHPERIDHMNATPLVVPATPPAPRP
jgi:hypothetical protein